MSDTTATTPPITVRERAPRREFHFNGAVLADPGSQMGPDEVRKMYAQSGYPTLANASVTGPETRDGKQIYTFKAAVGTKG